MTRRKDLVHTEKYTIRYLDGGPVETQQDVWDTICMAVDFAMDELDLPGHLFVSVIGAEALSADSGAGWGLYHSGIRHIAIPGGDGPEELKDDRSHWLHEIEISTIHEVVHYWQELNGRLDDSEACEEEADRKSREIQAIRRRSGGKAERAQFREALPGDDDRYELALDCLQESGEEVAQLRQKLAELQAAVLEYIALLTPTFNEVSAEEFERVIAEIQAAQSKMKDLADPTPSQANE